MRAWAESLLGDLAERLGDARAAEEHFGRALAVDPRDAWTLGAWADLLIEAGRYGQVIARLGDRTDDDALLLRLVIAEKRAGVPGGHAELLRARYEASHMRGDVVHRREQARFALEVDGDARAALDLARANWEVQKEIADARVLLAASRAAGDREAARSVLAWRARWGVTDRALDELSS
jgi:hypothetical protein